MQQRASEEQFAELHNLVTKEYTARVQLGSEASTADLKGAADWLAKNNITGVALSGSPLGNLLAGLGELDQEDVERAIR